MSPGAAFGPTLKLLKGDTPSSLPLLEDDSTSFPPSSKEEEEEGPVFFLLPPYLFSSKQGGEVGKGVRFNKMPNGYFNLDGEKG